jgi:hypothetical protein
VGATSSPACLVASLARAERVLLSHGSMCCVAGTLLCVARLVQSPAPHICSAVDARPPIQRATRRQTHVVPVCVPFETRQRASSCEFCKRCGLSRTFQARLRPPHPPPHQPREENPQQSRPALLHPPHRAPSHLIQALLQKHLARKRHAGAGVTPPRIATAGSAAERQAPAEAALQR